MNDSIDLSQRDVTQWSVNEMATPVVFDPLTHTPTRANAVITVGVGRRGLDMLAISRPSIKAYAEKVDADYVEITRACPSIGIFPIWDKFRVESYFDFYERIIYVDSDIVIRDTAPNLFELVPETHVGKTEDLYNMTGGFAWYYQECEELVRSQGYEMPLIPKYMLNSGLYVASREHRHAFKPMMKPFRAVHCAEQHHISMMLTKLDTPIHLIDDVTHWQHWKDLSLKNLPRCQFCHFAGLNDHRKRLALMSVVAASTARQTPSKAVGMSSATEDQKTAETAPEGVKKPCNCGEKNRQLQKTRPLK